MSQEKGTLTKLFNRNFVIIKYSYYTVFRENVYPQGHAVSQLCKTVEDVSIYGTASVHKHETIKDNVTSVIDRSADYVQEVRK